MKVRLFALITIACTIIGLIDSVRLVLIGHLDTPGFLTFDNTTAIFSIVTVSGVIFALLALIDLETTGTSLIFRMLTWVPVIGAVALIVGYILKLVGVPVEEIRFFGAFGQLTNMGGLVIVAILTLAAKRWPGWRKFTPLLTVLAIPLGAMVVGLTGLDGWFGIVYRLSLLLLGYALYTTQSAIERTHGLATVN